MYFLYIAMEDNKMLDMSDDEEQYNSKRRSRPVIWQKAAFQSAIMR